MVKLLIVCVGFETKIKNISVNLMNDHVLIENVMHIDVHLDVRARFSK